MVQWSLYFLHWLTNGRPTQWMIYYMSRLTLILLNICSKISAGAEHILSSVHVCCTINKYDKRYVVRSKSTPSQLAHNVFITLLKSCAELFWDKRCSNLVATFDQIYFVWQFIWVISNVVTTLQQRYLATYNVAATLFGNISPTFAQSCHSTLWQRSRNFPG